MKRRLTILLLLATTLSAACSGNSPAREVSPNPSSSAATPSVEVRPPSPRLVGTPPKRAQQLLRFSGYQWRVTNEPAGAPPTTVGGFSGRHAWVDSQGRLNLRLQRIGRTWQGGAVVSARAGWGYGTYRWTVDGRIDGFDKHVVAGLFTYEQGAPGNREIDIEMARFGRDSVRPNISSTLFYRNGDSFTRNWAVGPQQRTTHAFTWQPGRVTWTSRDGNNRVIYRTQARTSVTPGNERVHMNLWICCERSPARAQQIVISNFSFRPYPRS